jgi:hypothetical protein
MVEAVVYVDDLKISHVHREILEEVKRGLIQRNEANTFIVVMLSPVSVLLFLPSQSLLLGGAWTTTFHNHILGH